MGNRLGCQNGETPQKSIQQVHNEITTRLRRRAMARDYKYNACASRTRLAEAFVEYHKSDQRLSLRNIQPSTHQNENAIHNTTTLAGS